ncbi:MAG: hypothetical protein IJX28_06355 [Clostridia bacterium]|nr:hypothetical protein [Clostridia bacterium]
MYVDLFEKKRFKVNLHTHTSLSDGRRSPSEALRLYREHGYDAVALTDHWVWTENAEAEGITVLSGIEYNCGGSDGRDGVFHIVGIGCTSAPAATKSMGAQELIDAIHAAGGLAVLAHPAWSLNTHDQILPLEGVDATEIYNTTSGLHHSRRPDASLIVDMLGARGRFYPLIADDDTHYYDGDECKSFIMVRAEDASTESLTEAIAAGDFYASQGPEVHLKKEGDEYVAYTSPCASIVFLSNLVWSRRAFEGEGLTEARYKPREGERYLRVEVTDADGKRAWTNILPL